MPQQWEQFAHGPARAGAPGGRRRLDLTATQVAASALAAVAGAVLASELGVYGTILGAAVVSVGATVGSALFQHLLKRTGEQLRSAVERGTESAPTAHRAPVPANGISQDWNAPRVLRAKHRWTWKSSAAASALVFAVAMVPIVVVELAAGKPLHALTTGQDGGGTSFNPSRPSGDQRPKAPDAPAGPNGHGPSELPSSAGPAAPSGSPGPAASPEPTPTGAAPSTGAPSSVTPTASASPSAAAPGAQDGLPAQTAQPAAGPSGATAG